MEKIHAEKEDQLPEAVKSNAAEVAAHIRQTAELGELKDSVRVVQAYYDLDTGKVSWTEK